MILPIYIIILQINHRYNMSLQKRLYLTKSQSPYRIGTHKFIYPAKSQPMLATPKLSSNLLASCRNKKKKKKSNIYNSRLMESHKKP